MKSNLYEDVYSFYLSRVTYYMYNNINCTFLCLENASYSIYRLPYTQFWATFKVSSLSFEIAH